jgi:trigger factor
MQTQIEDLGRLKRRLMLSLPAADIDRKVEERLKSMARTVRMHGFRPGKVPLRLVTNQYGPQVRAEVIGDALEKDLVSSLSNHKLRVAGRPSIEPKEDAGPGELTFTATFEIYPEINLGDVRGSVIERPVVTVDDAAIDSTLAILRKQRTRYAAADRGAENGDRITLDIVGRIDGEPFPGSDIKGHTIVLGEGQMLAAFEAEITGLAAGGAKSFDFVFPPDYRADVAGKTARFDVNMSLVEAGTEPQVDAEFARKLGVEDGDLVRMRQEIADNLGREVKRRVQARLKDQVMQSLLNNTQVEAPEALIDAEIQRALAGMRQELESRGQTPANFPTPPREQMEPAARRRVSLGLILAELVKVQGLDAKPEQTRAVVEEHAQSFEKPDEVVRWYYAERGRLDDVNAVVVEDNVVNWVLAHAAVTDLPVPFDEFMGANR